MRYKKLVFTKSIIAVVVTAKVVGLFAFILTTSVIVGAAAAASAGVLLYPRSITRA